MHTFLQCWEIEHRYSQHEDDNWAKCTKEVSDNHQIIHGTPASWHKLAWRGTRSQSMCEANSFENYIYRTQKQLRCLLYQSQYQFLCCDRICSLQIRWECPQCSYTCCYQHNTVSPSDDMWAPEAPEEPQKSNSSIHTLIFIHEQVQAPTINIAL